MPKVGEAGELHGSGSGDAWVVERVQAGEVGELGGPDDAL